jgi:hypothetical protein
MPRVCVPPAAVSLAAARLAACDLHVPRPPATSPPTHAHQQTRTHTRTHTHAECGNPAPELHFETASGLLTVSRAAADEGGGGGGRLRLAMSLPLAEPSSRALPPSLAAEPLHGGPGSIGGARPTRCVRLGRPARMQQRGRSHTARAARCDPCCC